MAAPSINVDTLVTPKNETSPALTPSMSMMRALGSADQVIAKEKKKESSSSLEGDLRNLSASRPSTGMTRNNPATSMMNLRNHDSAKKNTGSTFRKPENRETSVSLCSSQTGSKLSVIAEEVRELPPLKPTPYIKNLQKLKNKHYGRREHRFRFSKLGRDLFTELKNLTAE